MKRKLRIESGHSGLPINEYRIVDGEIEVRTIRASFPHPRQWRQMNENELRLHENLNSPVAQWFEAQLQAQEVTA
jgi:hypothetical protein